MNVIDTAIPDVKIIEPRVFEDERGFFFESFNQQRFNQAIGREVSFVQDNHSKSSKGVLRGLHYQRPPHAQGKLVRCVVGEVFDIAVDIREGSSTFGKWIGVTLSSDNKHQLWIPPGFAHGFSTVSEHAELLYKVTDFYAKDSEGAIRWDDATLAITWPLDPPPLLSIKDANAPLFGSTSYFD